MNCIIVTIGDELLIGQVVNTNAAYIAQKLNNVGIGVVRTITVGDDEKDILNAISEGLRQADVTIATGGLGPTHDDITKRAICSYFHVDLILNRDALEDVRDWLKRRSASLTKAAEEQALIPRNASIIHNRLGTAPGLLIEQDGRYFIAMPGVPYEMEKMVDDHIVPYLREKSSGNVILHRTLNTTGIPESLLAEQIGDPRLLPEGTRLAFLPSPNGVRLRITVNVNEHAAAHQKINEVETRIRSKVQKYIYGIDGETLEEVIGKLLLAQHLSMAVAESCTGGLISHRITNVSGSSQYFDRCVVAYSNRTKIENLNLSAEILETYGAVSKEVAEAMASGIRSLSHADIGISTTGIAGPTGGSAEKPVGLVWVGYSAENETFSQKFQFGPDRLRIKERAAQAALDLLRRKLLKLS